MSTYFIYNVIDADNDEKKHSVTLTLYQYNIYNCIETHIFNTKYGGKIKDIQREYVTAMREISFCNKLEQDNKTEHLLITRLQILKRIYNIRCADFHWQANMVVALDALYMDQNKSILS